MLLYYIISYNFVRASDIIFMRETYQMILNKLLEFSTNSNSDIKK